MKQTIVKLNYLSKVLLFLFYGFFVNLHAQQTITSTSILRTLNESRQVLSDSATVSSLMDYNYNIPLIGSVELRTESRDLLLERQEYTIRIKPNSLGAMNHQKKLYQNKILEVETENKIRLNKDLENRYYLILDLIFNERSIELHKERQSLLRDKLKVLGESIYDSKFDVKDLVDAEDDLLATNLKINQLNEEKNRLQYTLNQMIRLPGSNFRIDTLDLIGAKEIMDYDADTTTVQNLEITLQEIKLEIIDNEMKVEASKSKQVFDYFQARYGGQNSFLFDENFSLGMGINIPFFGNTRERKGEYYFDRLNEENELEELKYSIKEDLKGNIDAFKLSMSNYQALYDQTRNSSVLSLLNTYKKIEGVPPLTLLNLLSLQHKKKIETLKAEHLMYKSYVKLLAAQEVLFQDPLVNHLSRNRDFIDR